MAGSELQVRCAVRGKLPTLGVVIAHPQVNSGVEPGLARRICKAGTVGPFLDGLNAGAGSNQPEESNMTETSPRRAPFLLLCACSAPSRGFA